MISEPSFVAFFASQPHLGEVANRPWLGHNRLKIRKIIQKFIILLTILVVDNGCPCACEALLQTSCSCSSHPASWAVCLSFQSCFIQLMTKLHKTCFANTKWADGVPADTAPTGVERRFNETNLIKMKKIRPKILTEHSWSVSEPAVSAGGISKRPYSNAPTASLGSGIGISWRTWRGSISGCNPFLANASAIFLKNLWKSEK